MVVTMVAEKAAAEMEGAVVVVARGWFRSTVGSHSSSGSLSLVARRRQRIGRATTAARCLGHPPRAMCPHAAQVRLANGVSKRHVVLLCRRDPETPLGPLIRLASLPPSNAIITQRGTWSKALLVAAAERTLIAN